MKRSTLTIVFLTITLCACHRQSIPDRLTSDAQEITEQCPIMIDAATQLDSMTYETASNTVTYHYTICGTLDNDSTIQILKDNIRSQQAESIKNSVDLMQYKKWEVNLGYDYYSQKDGHLLFKMIFTKDDYQ